MSRTVTIRPLTAQAFAPFGEVIEAVGAPTKMINQGKCARHHDLAGLDFAAGQGAEHIMTVAADTPFFPETLVEHLIAHAGPTGLCLAASRDTGGKLWRQPTFGLWPVALRHDLRAALKDGLRKVVLWTDQHNAGQAEFQATPFDPFFNVNTPQDLTQAQSQYEAMR